VRLVFCPIFTKLLLSINHWSYVRMQHASVQVQLEVYKWSSMDLAISAKGSDHVELVACKSSNINPSKLARTIAFNQAVYHLQAATYVYIWSTFFGMPPLAFISVSARSSDHQLNRFSTHLSPCYVLIFVCLVCILRNFWRCSRM
jgi:hypothetical protein